jgi:predicted CopG family antitoxin
VIQVIRALIQLKKRACLLFFSSLFPYIAPEKKNSIGDRSFSSVIKLLKEIKNVMT